MNTSTSSSLGGTSSDADGSSKKAAQFGILAVCAVFLIGFIVGGIGFYNDSVGAETDIEAQARENRNRYSNMRVQLTELAGVDERYRQSVLAVFDRVVQARQGSQNETVRLIAEANPGIDNATSLRLAQAIEVRRQEFAAAQSTLIDRRREYDKLRRQMPGSLYNRLPLFGGFPKIDLDAATRIVVTAETEQVFAPNGHDTPLPLGR